MKEESILFISNSDLKDIPIEREGYSTFPVVDDLNSLNSKLFISIMLKNSIFNSLKRIKDIHPTTFIGLLDDSIESSDYDKLEIIDIIFNRINHRATKFVFSGTPDELLENLKDMF